MPAECMASRAAAAVLEQDGPLTAKSFGSALSCFLLWTRVRFHKFMRCTGRSRSTTTWHSMHIHEFLQVDAALDLSHTQNIGRMIKSHFPYSQFIVVSLKEGMFNNANVIFRTKFVDGVSAVTRTVPDRR